MHFIKRNIFFIFLKKKYFILQNKNLEGILLS